MSKFRSKLKFLELYFRHALMPSKLNRGAIFVTRRCNKKCSYCYTKKENNPGEELSLEQIQEVIDKLKEAGVRYLTIYGGEPTLREDLSDIIQHAHSEGMFTIVNTNGSFSKVSVDDVVNAGVNVVDIAIDSMSDQRLKNYMEVKETLKRLVHEFDVGVKLNYCILKENYHETEDILGLAEHYKIPISIHLGVISPFDDSGAGYDPSMFFKKGDMGDIEQVEQISKSLANKTVNNGARIINSMKYFEAWPRFMKGEKLKWKCDAGKSSLSIDYDGTILQCVSATSPVEIFGQVMDYRDIDKHNINIVKKRVQELTKQCNPECLSCTYMLEHHLKSDPVKVFEIALSF